MNELQKIWKEQLHNQPILCLENDVVYIQPSNNGKYIEYGTCVTNNGLIVDGQYEYDFSMSLDKNIQELYDEIICCMTC